MASEIGVVASSSSVMLVASHWHRHSRIHPAQRERCHMHHHHYFALYHSYYLFLCLLSPRYQMKVREHACGQWRLFVGSFSLLGWDFWGSGVRREIQRVHRLFWLLWEWWRWEVMTQMRQMSVSVLVSLVRETDQQGE